MVCRCSLLIIRVIISTWVSVRRSRFIRLHCWLYYRGPSIYIKLLSLNLVSTYRVDQKYVWFWKRCNKVIPSIFPNCFINNFKLNLQIFFKILGFEKNEFLNRIVLEISLGMFSFHLLNGGNSNIRLELWIDIIWQYWSTVKTNPLLKFHTQW